MDDELKATLNYARRPDQSLSRAYAEHLANGQLFDAALAARALGRPTEAAALFDQANHHAEAAACWEEAGDFKRALDSASRVSRDHALYPSCARLAVTAAAKLNQVSRELDTFVAPWVKRGPKDTYDSETFLALGELYARHGRVEDARAVFVRLLRSTVGSEARARLDDLNFGQHKPPREPARPPPLPKRARPRAPLAPPRPSTDTEQHASPLTSSSELSLSAPTPGTILAGRYRLDWPLGHGGSSTVFRATDLALDESVAIKLFTGSFDPEQRQRFRREINLARKLAHDHILRIFELVLAGPVQGITMELIDGVTLDVFVDEARSSFAERRDLLVQAARAVGYAHRQGVVHRDIKPANMLVRRDGVLKVSDFGIAKACEEATITASGAFHGTPYYVSPEQISNFKTVDHRADIYSLGVVAYELFTGRVPFDGLTMVDLLVQHTKAEPPRPRNIAPSLPVELEEILLSLLAKDPDKRIQSCDLLADELEAIPLS